MIRTLGTLTLALTLLGACTPARSPAVRGYAARPVPSPEITLEELSRLRSLPVEAPIPIDVLDDAPFVRALHEWDHGVQRDSMFWSAFTMASSKTNMREVTRSLVDANLSGFYDWHTKRLYVRRADPRGSSEVDRLTVAHEEEHALQDRYFGVPDLGKITNGDQALSLRALFEGDATLASTVLDATRSGSTAAERIAEVARLSESDDASVMRAAGVHAANDAPPLLRAELLWPYRRGTAFVAQLAASGGWALVDEALRNPPKTTEQVLHIEKYVAGEGPVEVRSPAAPEGYRVVESGEMGELRTRFFLSQCMKDADASKAAVGWGGDAFAIVSSGPARGLLWSTAWDDEGAAARFEAALGARRGCARTGEKPAFAVVRDGKRVAFAQGLDDDASRAKEATLLLTLVGKTPPSVPPFGAVSLRLRPPISSDFAHGETIENGRFVDRPIGVESDLKDLKRANNPNLELLATGDFVSVAVTFAWGPPSSVLSDTLVSTFVDGLRSSKPQPVVVEERPTRVRVGGTLANARTLLLDSREARVVLLPTCGGKMTIVLVSVWKVGTYGSDTADDWLKSIKASDASPACEALQSQRDPRK